MNKRLTRRDADAPASRASAAAAQPRRRNTWRIDPSAGAQLKARQQDAPAGAVLLACRDLYKSYHKGRVVIPVLRGVDAQIKRGQFTAIVGQSGSGKTTLLHLLATLDRPDKGHVLLDDQRIDNLPAKARDRLRNQRLGMVFQSYHLLPELTALENVLLPLMIACSPWSWWRKRKAYLEQAQKLLELVGLQHRQTHRPLEMSGGEMQRTAIARALISQPDVLFADEPTGNLDPETGEGVIRLLKSLNERHGLTVAMVTHNESIARGAHMTLRLHQGKVQQI